MWMYNGHSAGGVDACMIGLLNVCIYACLCVYVRLFVWEDFVRPVFVCLFFPYAQIERNGRFKSQLANPKKRSQQKKSCE